MCTSIPLTSSYQREVMLETYFIKDPMKPGVGDITDRETASLYKVLFTHIYGQQ